MFFQTFESHLRVTHRNFQANLQAEISDKQQNFLSYVNILASNVQNFTFLLRLWPFCYHLVSKTQYIILWKSFAGLLVEISRLNLNPEISDGIENVLAENQANCSLTNPLWFFEGELSARCKRWKTRASFYFLLWTRELVEFYEVTVNRILWGYFLSKS